MAKLTLEQLKAAAYDILVAIDHHRAQLKEVNDLIAKEVNNGLRKSTVEPPKREPEAKETEPGAKPYPKD